jgi:hypothetical protein
MCKKATAWQSFVVLLRTPSLSRRKEEGAWSTEEERCKVRLFGVRTPNNQRAVTSNAIRHQVLKTPCYLLAVLVGIAVI